MLVVAGYTGGDHASWASALLSKVTPGGQAKSTNELHDRVPKRGQRRCACFCADVTGVTPRRSLTRFTGFDLLPTASLAFLLTGSPLLIRFCHRRSLRMDIALCRKRATQVVTRQKRGLDALLHAYPPWTASHSSLMSVGAAARDSVSRSVMHIPSATPPIRRAAASWSAIAGAGCRLCLLDRIPQTVRAKAYSGAGGVAGSSNLWQAVIAAAGPVFWSHSRPVLFLFFTREWQSRPVF